MSAVDLDLSEFIGRRIKNLATVFLTTHPGVRVSTDERFVYASPVESYFGVDLLARIGPQSQDQALLFGVILKGTTDSIRNEAEATERLNHGSLAATRLQSYPFPVIELIYSMEGDRGYYAWRNEPVVTSQGGGRLTTRKVVACHETSGRKTLDKIVDRVQQWYDFFYVKLTE